MVGKSGSPSFPQESEADPSVEDARKRDWTADLHMSAWAPGLDIYGRESHTSLKILKPPSVHHYIII